MILDELDEKVLRINVEPCDYFGERYVHRELTSSPLEYFSFVLKELKAIAAGRVSIELPPKQIFQDPDSAADFRVMPCVVRSASDVRKTVKLVGTNILQKKVPDQITVGKALVIDPQENFVSHIFDACLLSSARTGICAAIATDLLSVSRERVTVFGAGRVGYYAAFYAAALNGVREISFVDIDPDRAENTADLLSRQIAQVRFSVEKEGRSDKTDVLILATTSAQAVSIPPGPGANLIISLGADTDFQSELDPAWAAVSDIFVDTKDSMRFGDLYKWQQDGLISTDRITDLFGVLRNGAQPYSRTRILVSTGSALFDNITIGYLLDRIKGNR